jgi:hypothetical protein
LVWDAEAVAAQAEAWVDQLSEVHRFPRWARNDLTERIEQAAPTIAASRARERGDYPDEAGGSLCIEPIGSISVDLRSTWGSWSDSDWTDEGDCTLDLVYDGDPTLLTGGSGVSGDDGDSLADMGCYWSIDGAQLLPYFGTPFRSFGPGVIQTDNTTHYGILYYAPASGDWRSIGWLDGALELDEAEATVGAAVNGHFSGTVWQAAW